jgi:hypothetical protein
VGHTNNTFLLAIASALLGCAHTATAPTTRLIARVAELSSSAVPAAVDERVTLQGLLDAGAGGIVTIPTGRHVVKQSGATYYCLTVPGGTTVRGAPGAVLVQGVVPGGIRLLDVSAGGITIENLELDGQRAIQDPRVDEHRHGIVANVAPGLTIRNVVVHDFTGDGIYLYDGVDDATIDHVTVTDDDRNGLTLGGTSSRIRITNSRFAGSAAQQLDSEAPIGHQDDVTISGCTFDTLGKTQQYVLTISGSSAAVRSKNWLVEHNVINGGVLVVWGQDVTIRRNAGVNPTRFSSVRVYRASEGVNVEENDFTATQATAAAVGVISVAGTAGGPPRHTRIARNTLRATGAVAGGGIRAEGAASLEILDNDLVGPGFATPSSNAAGIYLRATITDPALGWDWAIVQRNRLSGWGATGFVVEGNGAARLELLSVTDNTFADRAGTMTAALSLDDGTGCARDVRQAGNLALGGVTMLVRAPPSGAWSAWGSGDRWVKP